MIDESFQELLIKLNLGFWDEYKVLTLAEFCFFCLRQSVLEIALTIPHKDIVVNEEASIQTLELAGQCCQLSSKTEDISS